MDENEFEFEGKSYVAVEQDKYPFCSGCAFEFCGCSRVPECVRSKRADNVNVIFVEKQ